MRTLGHHAAIAAHIDGINSRMAALAASFASIEQRTAADDALIAEELYFTDSGSAAGGEADGEGRQKARLQYAHADAEKAVCALELDEVPAGYAMLQGTATAHVPQLVQRWLDERRD